MSTLLNSVFARGGAVAMALDEELLSLVWGVAQKYAVALDAEPGDFVPEPLVYVITTSADDLVDYPDDGRRIRGAHEQGTEPFATAFADTGLVQLQVMNADTQHAPGPGRHYGLMLQANEVSNVDRRLLSMADEVTAVRWADQPAPQQPELAAEVLLLEGEAPPIQFLIEDVIAVWSGPQRGDLV